LGGNTKLILNSALQTCSIGKVVSFRAVFNGDLQCICHMIPRFLKCSISAHAVHSGDSSGFTRRRQ
jgi:hypothetical protein